MIDRNTQSYNRIDAILSILHQTHFRAASSLSLGASQHKDTRLQMLAERLASRQAEMVHFTTDSKDNTTHNVLTTWLQYTPVAGVDESLGHLVSDPTTQDISDHVLQMQSKIVEFTETLSEETNSPEVAALIDSLRERELMELKETAKAINDLKFLQMSLRVGRCKMGPI